MLKVIYAVKGQKGAHLIGKSSDVLQRHISSNAVGIQRGLSNLFDVDVEENKNKDEREENHESFDPIQEQDSISEIMRDRDLPVTENRSVHSTNLPGLKDKSVGQNNQRQAKGKMIDLSNVDDGEDGDMAK